MKSINRLLEIMRTLRDPEKGCPWDREQDFYSIVPYTLEEAYEVADAIELNDMDLLCDELGDLLFQVVYHSQVATEEGHFTFSDVVENIINKLINRHPHVFADTVIENAREQSLAWEKHKVNERVAKDHIDTKGLLGDISLNLPALTRAQKLQKRAATAGFDWVEPKEVVAKIEEEMQELEAELSGVSDNARVREELGDLLFTCVNLARHLDVDAESTLRSANRKFEYRFRYIEDQLKKQGRTVEEAGLEEMETFWREAKELSGKDR